MKKSNQKALLLISVGLALCGCSGGSSDSDAASTAGYYTGPMNPKPKPGAKPAAPANPGSTTDQ